MHRHGNGLPASVRSVPDAGSNAIIAQRPAANSPSIAGNPAGGRGQITFQDSQRLHPRLYIPDKPLIPQRHADIRRRGFAARPTTTPSSLTAAGKVAV